MWIVARERIFLLDYDGLIIDFDFLIHIFLEMIDDEYINITLTLFSSKPFLSTDVWGTQTTELVVFPRLYLTEIDVFDWLLLILVIYDDFLNIHTACMLKINILVLNHNRFIIYIIPYNVSSVRNHVDKALNLADWFFNVNTVLS